MNSVRLENWEVATLQKYGNVSLPPVLIKRYGVHAVEKALQDATGDTTVRIRITSAQVMTENGNITSKHHDTFVIAETEERRVKNGISRNK